MKKIRKLTVLCAILALMFSFSIVAYAIDVEEIPEAAETNTSEATNGLKPFTPTGTGTVINNATDEDGKEFFTIMTLDGNVFYLVIDRQRETENVYFLNAVTEKDLLALAEKPGDTGTYESVLSNPEMESTQVNPEPKTSAELSFETEQKSNAGMLFMVLAVVLIGGGAGYYFKIYRLKHQRTVSEDDLDYSDESGSDDSEESKQADNLPPWEDEYDGDDEV